MSGLKINFDKSEVVVLGYSEAEEHRITDNLNCRLASFPISYLGMPLAESRILLHMPFGALCVRLWDRSGRPMILQSFCNSGIRSLGPETVTDFSCIWMHH
ncbi:ABC transporter G family member 37 [Hordeum vulgare]|nr:ABC transporter G family member 37 [Hordeum vulgare]